MLNGWIAVRDRLPGDETRRYLVWCGYFAVCYFSKNNRGFYYYDSEYGNVSVDAEYWLPIPDVPKEGKQ